MEGVSRRLFTSAEYHAMAEAGIFSEDERVELIAGEIVRMAPIGSRHAGCGKRLNRRFSHLGDRALVSVQDPIALSPQRVIEIYQDPSENGYRVVRNLHPGDSLSPQAFPDLELTVDAILR